jgi:tetratricopeptide (TPR) repeat protein
VLLEQQHFAEAALDFASSWTNYVVTAGPDTATTLESEDYLAQAYAGLGHTDEAAQIFADVARRWLRIVPYRIARNRCYGIANWFARNGMPDKGVTLMADLKTAVSRNPANSEFEFGVLTLAESAIKGWPAAAELCRAQFENFTDSPNVWRWKAVVFSYVGDHEWYSKAASRAIALIPVATNWDDQMHIVQAAARGRSVFSQEQLKQCEDLIDAIDKALPTVTRSQKRQGLRSIAALELKLGRPDAALQHVNEAWEYHSTETDSASTLFLKSLCLHAVGNATDAWAAFEAAEVEFKRWLPEPVSAYEGFLNEPERYCILLRRQAEAVTRRGEPDVKK